MAGTTKKKAKKANISRASKSEKKTTKDAPIMGRPRKEFDAAIFEELCEIHCTKQEICGIFRFSEDTLENRLREVYGETFTALFKVFSAGGKSSLRRAQYKNAMGGNFAAQQWLGKQWLGQRDKQEIDHSFEPTIIERLDGGEIELGVTQKGFTDESDS